MAMVMFPLFSIRVHAAEYEIVFKAGAHGTINGNKEASYRLSSDDVFPDEPDIQVEKGYVFVGWNKQLLMRIRWISPHLKLCWES